VASRPLVLVVVTSLLCACGGARERPEPPSGAVDPGAAGLATPGLAGGGAAPDAIDPTPRGAAGPGAPHAGDVAAPAAGPRAPAEATGEAAGSMVVTREHCEALGRKFAEMTLEQGGVLGGSVDEAGKREAEGVGKTFADRCKHDLVGQTVAARDYQCMLRARSTDDLLACKK
jgi:hypothetical protein